MSERILIIEDDEDIALVERDYLELGGYEVVIEADGQRGLALAKTGGFDLIILDIMLPSLDGMEICRQLRETSDVPILVVSARTSDPDQIRALGLGADNYMTKPFSPSVLTAQVKSILSRYRKLKGIDGSEVPLELGNLHIDPATHQVRLGERSIELKNMEFQLLLFLARNPGVIFDRDSLYERVWGLNAAGHSSTVTVHMKRLRDKLEADPANPRMLLTVRGAGYCFKAPENEE